MLEFENPWSISTIASPNMKSHAWKFEKSRRTDGAQCTILVLNMDSFCCQNLGWRFLIKLDCRGYINGRMNGLFSYRDTGDISSNSHDSVTHKRNANLSTNYTFYFFPKIVQIGVGVVENTTTCISRASKQNIYTWVLRKSRSPSFLTTSGYS